MKCANETVTIELKNGKRRRSIPSSPEAPASTQTVIRAWRAQKKYRITADATTSLYRHNPPWNHHLGVAADEHLASDREDDPQGP